MGLRGDLLPVKIIIIMGQTDAPEQEEGDGNVISRGQGRWDELERRTQVAESAISCLVTKPIDELETSKWVRSVSAITQFVNVQALLKRAIVR